MDVQPEDFKNCGGNRYGAVPFSRRSSILGQHGVVATQQALAAEVGLEILKKGGNAVDAAIAVNAVMTVMEPSQSGVGGDLFAMVWDPRTNQLYGLNGSGRSSKSMTFEKMAALLRKDGETKIPLQGPLSHSIPGTVDAWFELNRRFSTRSMHELLQPAIHYAEFGFPVHHIPSDDFASAQRMFNDEEYRNILTRNGQFPGNLRGFYEIFTNNGTVPTEGQVFKNPRLAETFRQIANQRGDDVFYRGEIARKLAAFYKRAGVPLTFEDLNAHTSTWVEPMSTNYRGWDVWELPPNGQGFAVLEMLNVLEGFNLTAMGHLSADYLHVHIAAKQLAYADLAMWYADPEFNNLDYSKLISKKYAAQQRRKIDMEKAFIALEGGNPFRPGLEADPEQEARIDRGDTILATIADNDGMFCVILQSNFDTFGSGLIVPELGFALQNRGALFAMQRLHFNRFQANKRPFHTVIPGFVTVKGKPLMGFGVKGSSMQAMGHAQIITNMVDFKMTPQEAGDAARYRHEGSNDETGYVMMDGGHVGFESGVSSQVRQELRRRGHVIDATAPNVGGHQAVLWDEVNGVYWGASEMRFDGHAVAY